MPITTIQRQFRELGRIRLGQQVEYSKNGQKRKRPEKLDTFRLTSPVRALLEHAAEVYGGKVAAWPDAPDGDEFQLITTTDTLDIIVPPNGAVSQWYELWSGAGCQRRCDGVREILSMGPCKCPADPLDRTELAAKGEACKPTTRLQVVLPKVPDLGIWLLVSHGYYAAVELLGTAELLAAAAQAGQMVPALLWIDQRRIRRPGQPTREFGVPAIRIPETMTALLGSRAVGATPALAAGDVAPAMPALGPGRPEIPAAAPLPEDPSFRAPAPAAQTASPDSAAAAAPSTSGNTGDAPVAAAESPTESWTQARVRAAATEAGIDKNAAAEALMKVADGRPTKDFGPDDWAAVADTLGL